MSQSIKILKKGCLCAALSLCYLSIGACQDKTMKKKDEYLVFEDFKKDKSIILKKGTVRTHYYKNQYYYAINVHVEKSIDSYNCYILSEPIIIKNKKIESFSGDISNPLTNGQLLEFGHQHQLGGFDNHYFIKNVVWKE